MIIETELAERTKAYIGYVKQVKSKTKTCSTCSNSDNKKYRNCRVCSLNKRTEFKVSKHGTCTKYDKLI